MVTQPERIDFVYEDTPDCFESLIAIINTFIEKEGFKKENIQNACMSIGGRVNPEVGCAYNYFTCIENHWLICSLRA